jgi:hypothetical protein
MNVLAFTAALKMSTIWRSWCHLMPRSELYYFATVLQDRHIMGGPRIFRVCGRLKKLDQFDLKMINIEHKIKQINPLQ